MAVPGLLAVWGLHPADVAILAVCLGAVLAIGVRVSRSVQKESDFYLGGRRLGRILQFFLHFGNMTDATGAVGLSSSVFRQGVAGMWISFQTLFITPFFWFMHPWFRRTRLVTMADLFVDRFDSKALATSYAVFNVFIALFGLAMGNVISFKVTSAMVVKPEAEYTVAEKRQVEDYREYQGLKTRMQATPLSPAEKDRLEVLDNRGKRGDLPSFVSYIKRVPFYVAYSAVVGVYIILGGLKAAAITDAVQGLLILVMSVLLIPIGLHYIGRELGTGGFAALHRLVPEYRFRLFGTVQMNEYAWYTIVGIFLGSLVQMIGLMHNMSLGGSAKDEDTARFGALSGGFTKRLVLIAWTLCGLIALAVFARDGLSDPDNAWGALSKKLLGPGLMGLMLSGMLLGHMPAVGVSAVSVSALAVRNLYEPLVKGRDPAHYLRAGQWAVAAVLGLAIVIALAFTDVVSMMTTLITFNIFFGAAIFLLLFWRRLTAPAVLVGLGLWVVLIGAIPFLCPYVESFRRHPAFLLRTEPRTAVVTAGATAADVAGGLAARPDETIRKTVLIPPAPVFFERVARVDPADPKSPLEGIGRFHTETYLLHLAGVPVQKFPLAGLTAARWFFDALFPFLTLIAFSLVTPRRDPARADRFYAKMKTPVGPTPEEDRAAVARSAEQPGRFDHAKLLPGTDWEFTKWSRRDVLGFGACWVIVGLILLVLWAVVSVGSGSPA